MESLAPQTGNNESAPNQTQKDNDIRNEIITVIERDNLSSEEKAQQIASIIKFEQYSGPIPPPFFLEGYQKLIPDAPERFLQMVEEEHKATIEIQKELTNAQIIKVRNNHLSNLLSQIFAFILVILFVIAGGYLTATGHDTIGGIIFGTTIIGVAGLFITGSYNKLRKQKQKQEY